MGLDWLAVIPATREEKEEYIKKHYFKELETNTMDELIEAHAPKNNKPCVLVGAKKMKDSPDFEKTAMAIFERNALTETGTTLEDIKENLAEKWDCQNCPLLKKLQGADSRESFFLGMTVSSCDYRGKVIGSDDKIAGFLKELAYNNLTCEEMIGYAEFLEGQAKAFRQNGSFKKIPYEEYLEKFEKDPFTKFLKSSPLTETEYKKEDHWRERNLKNAIHWLRTCAEHEINMVASY